MNEMKKYAFYFKAKYRLITENYNRPDLIILVNQLSADEQSIYNTLESAKKEDNKE